MRSPYLAELASPGALLTSAISVGTAAGSAVAGQVVDAGGAGREGARWGYVLAAGCAAGACLACLAGLPALRTPRCHRRRACLV